jgi:tripartite ATP-independent transporter DctM subunit
MILGLGNPELALVMLGVFVVLILLGFPVAFTLMALGVAFGYVALGDTVLQLVVQRTYTVMANDVLISVPLFVFMGYVVERANILDRLFHSLRLLAGPLPGALALAALATCAMFATATGIVGAVVTLMGLLAFPAMLRAGYDVKLSSGVICAGGCLGILIPPSIMLIVYGASAGVSVVRLYAAALLPGFLLAGTYMFYVLIRALISPKLAPPLPPEERNVSLVTVLVAVVTSFLPLAFLIVAVLGAILAGWATASEAAALGALGALLLAIGYRSLTLQKLKESIYLTASTTAMICWLFIGANIFSSTFALLGGHQPIEHFVLSLDLHPVAFLVISQVIIFLLGWPLDWTEIIIIFVPIFLPLLEHFDIDPLFFGVLIAVNLQTAFLSPPVAMAAFYLKGIAPPHVTINQIFAGVLPFIAIILMVMVVMYVFPQVVYWLPDVLYGRR